VSKKQLPSQIVKKSKKSVMSLIFSRLGIITLMFLVQIGVLIFALYNFENIFPHFYGCGIVISAVAVLYLANCPMNPNAKITWLILMVVAPVFGSLLLIYTRSDVGHRALKKRTDKVLELTKQMISQPEDVKRELEEINPGIAGLSEYVARSGCHPVYNGTKVTYFHSGEAKYEALLEELKKAEKFIFLEYFIIEEGKMWDSVLEILKEKAKSGVDVRLMYDGTCEFTTLPHDYPRKLKQMGINCKIFAPITPFVSTHYNYRDHRKIVVIDGRVAFNGGINLADEYINIGSKYGHWKDSAVMLCGDAVDSFTLMFLQMWGLYEKSGEWEHFLSAGEREYGENGFVMPFGDCPVDRDKTGERVYMDILNRATDYVHIMTPYLIIDSEMEAAIRFAAERGVEVILILPGIPDKKGAWALAKTHYRALLDSGVKIFEYTPGFVHSKVFVADSSEAVVGTINLDFRSLYHHFECAVYMAYTPCIKDIERDFDETRAKCCEVTYESIKKEKLTVKIKGMILKLVAPLM